MERRQAAAAAQPGQSLRAGADDGGLRQRRPALIVYLDTSGLVKLLVEEDGSKVVERAVREAEVIAALVLTYVEARAALARMRAGGRLEPNDHGASLRELDGVWDTIAKVAVDADLVTRAAALADRHLLRAYDAMQLAGALELAGAQQPGFACWDGDLRAAALDEGLALVPE
ncbi:MAG: type II toxin-antitoxin system VapC family toxin [Thermoleophilaceae bacterium]